VHLRMRKLPVARDEGLVVEQVGDETVVYDDRSKEAHCLNPLAGIVFANCDGRTSVDRLAALASERLGEPVEVATVLDALAQLDERNLMAFVPPDGGFSRRAMIRKSAAVAGGVSLAPVISSIVAPSAIAQGSATCANLLCCPCCTNANLNKEDCCTIQNVTINCECTGFRTVAYPGGVNPNANAKYCKPSGVAAPSDADCAGMFPANGQAAATCTGSTAGFGACDAC
jgi:hypothetical protein